MIAQDFEVVDCGSDEKVIKKAAALLRAQQCEIIGIVLDADNPNLLGKWMSLRDRLQKLGVKLPNAPDPNGTVVEGTTDHPRIGAWLMPNNSIDGMLEDFCASIAHPESFAFASKCVDDAKASGHTKFKSSHLTKAQVHTYLAWQDEPGKPLGQSITALALDPKHELARTFAEWMKRLFRP
jgi:hypothetical protein